MVLIWPFVLLIFLCITDQNKLNKDKDFLPYRQSSYKYKKVYCFLLLYCICISGFRWCGPDWENYLSFHRQISQGSFGAIFETWFKHYEIGYVVYTLLVTRITKSYTIYLFITAIMISALIYPVLYKYSRYPMLSLMACYAVSTCYIYDVPRSGIAIALCFRAFDCIVQKKTILFYIYVMIATLFHNTAIVFIVSYLAFDFIISETALITMAGVSVITAINSKKIITWLYQRSLLSLGNRVRFERYFSSDETISSLTGIGIQILTRGFFLFLIFFFLWKKRKKNRLLNGLINLYFISFMFYMISWSTTAVMERMAYYFEQTTQYFILCESVGTCKNKKILLLIILLFFSLKYVARFFIGYGIEYTTIFSMMG